MSSNEKFSDSVEEDARGLENIAEQGISLANSLGSKNDMAPDIKNEPEKEAPIQNESENAPESQKSGESNGFNSDNGENPVNNENPSNEENNGSQAVGSSDEGTKDNGRNDTDHNKPIKNSEDESHNYGDPKSKLEKDGESKGASGATQGAKQTGSNAAMEGAKNETGNAVTTASNAASNSSPLIKIATTIITFIAVPVAGAIFMIMLIFASIFDDGGARVSSSASAGTFPAYYQADPQWANVPYGTETIASSGCGIVSAASAVTGLTGETVQPTDLVELGNKSYIAGVGTNASALCTDIAVKYNLEYKSVTSMEEAKEVIKQGGVAIASVHGQVRDWGPTGDSGHLILLYGVTSDGGLNVIDPAGYGSSTNSTQPWTKEEVDACSWDGNYYCLMKK